MNLWIIYVNCNSVASVVDTSKLRYGDESYDDICELRYLGESMNGICNLRYGDDFHLKYSGKYVDEIYII